jgi:hypothetical protein
MRYERKFDWDEAIRLRKQGLTLKEIAERCGVSVAAVNRVVNPQVARRLEKRSREFQRSGTCSECGRRCSRNYAIEKLRPPICKRCAARAKQTRFRRDAAGRVKEVRCAGCKTWKPRKAFPRGSGSEGIHTHCRKCNTINKRDWRERNAAA